MVNLKNKEELILLTGAGIALSLFIFLRFGLTIIGAWTAVCFDKSSWRYTATYRIITTI